MTEIELGTAEKEKFQTPRAALAQHPRTTSLPTATCLHEDLAVSGQTGDESSGEPKLRSYVSVLPQRATRKLGESLLQWPRCILLDTLARIDFRTWIPPATLSSPCANARMMTLRVIVLFRLFVLPALPHPRETAGAGVLHHVLPHSAPSCRGCAPPSTERARKRIGGRGEMYLQNPVDGSGAGRCVCMHYHRCPHRSASYMSPGSCLSG
ncbi:hypothetical protein B0H13DRAFT_2310369 [Mycena leptocephala]|nr:hypothetical protein B0H13DRAFT_2310369 [Mycena leptocephala]